MKYMKNFIKTNFLNIDEKSIYKNLGRTKQHNFQSKIHEAAKLIQDSKDSTKNKETKDLDMNSQKWKDFMNAMNNPSIGIEYLRKMYPTYYNKYKNVLEKYDNRFKRNFMTKHLGTVLMASKTSKESDDANKYENVKNTKLAMVSKLKMKWKTIKWLIDNKKETLDRLMKFNESILNLSNKKAREFDRGLNKQEFASVMKNNGITNDPDLINKLFWVFDEDGDNDLKYKEIAFGIEMFRDSTIEQKLKAFFDMCDVDSSGSISKLEFLNLMKKNIINNDEKQSIKNVVDKIFNSVQLDEKGEITL